MPLLTRIPQDSPDSLFSTPFVLNPAPTDAQVAAWYQRDALAQNLAAAERVDEALTALLDAPAHPFFDSAAIETLEAAHRLVVRFINLPKN